MFTPKKATIVTNAEKTLKIEQNSTVNANDTKENENRMALVPDV